MHEGTKIILGALAGGILAWIGWVSLSIHDFSSGNALNERQDDDIRELRATMQDLTVLVLQQAPPVAARDAMMAEPMPEPMLDSDATGTPGGAPVVIGPTMSMPSELRLERVPEFDQVQRSLEDSLRMRGFEPAPKRNN